MKTLATLLFMTIALSALAQDNAMPVSSFKKIVTSPKIKLVLKKGDKESVRITALNVDASQVNVVVKGNKLHIYLDDARYLEQNIKIWEEGYKWKRSMYSDASVTAYVTYKELKSVEMRGEERLICDEEIVAQKFKLRLYGRTEVRLASLKTGKLKATMYGENMLRIKAGTTGHQKYTLYGENLIDVTGVESRTAATTVYGEGRVAMNVLEEVRLNAFGEPLISVDGPAHVSKGIVIGRVGIRSGF